MINLMKIECYKLVKNKKNWIIYYLFLVFLSGIVLYNTYVDRNYSKLMMEEMKEEKLYAESTLAVINLILEKSKNIPADTVDEKDFWVKEQIISLQLEYYFKEYDGSGWEKYITLANEKYKNLLYGHEKGYINESLLKARKQSPEQLKEYILLNEYYLEHNIKPLENPHRLTGMNFLSILIEDYIPIILLILCILFSLDIFQKEFDEGSYKLSFTQPYKRKELFLYRVMSSWILQSGIFLITILFFFILLGMIHGFGGTGAPRILYSYNGVLPISKTGEIEIGSSLQYILLGYLLFYAVMFMFSLFTIFITFVFNSSSNAIGLLTGIFILSLAIITFIDRNNIFHLINPISYMNISKILKNRIYSWYTLGIFINIGLGLLFLKGSYQKFSAMDMLGGIDV